MQCGAACLAMICSQFGKVYRLDTISKLCSPTNEGVSLLGLKSASEKIGLTPIVAKIDIHNLAALNTICILHWNQNHFVVLRRIHKNRFQIADPNKGFVSYTEEEFKQHWISMTSCGEEKGIAVFFKRNKNFGTLESESISGHDSLKFLHRYFLPYRKYIFLILCGLLLSCILQLILPFLTQTIVDVGIRHKDVGLIWLILLGELAIVFGQTSIDFIRRWLLLHISIRINVSLVSDFFVKLLKLPMSFFDTKLLGDLMQRMSDHSRVQSFLTNQTIGVMFTLFSFVVFGIVLCFYNRLIFGVFIVGSLLYGGWMAVFLSRRKVLDYEMFEIQSINQNKTYEFISSMQEIKLQGCENRRRIDWENTQTDLFSTQLKVVKLQQAQEAGCIFINEIKNVIITVLSATAVINGSMTLGAMLAIQYIIGQLNSPVDQLMSFIYSFQDVKISLERINEIHNRENEDHSGAGLTIFDAQRNICIKNIDFKYDLHAIRKTLTDISLDIKEGQVTAIVGASGSGKTTLLKLMLGYYPIMSGSISIAGRNIDEYNLKWWRSHCGVVMQDGVIFSESIARNIAIDDDIIDVPRLEKAAQIANIHEYIMGLPMKYNTKIGRDGVGLSQGQKQRILIARAVYKEPDFIFLDEATNALDAENEKTIVENLNEFYKGRTVVVVAHRLSTVKNANRIIVLDGGKVVESGTHTSLITKKGTYYKLVKNQLELGN
jgi:ATP-binding cassette subfamily B protein